MTTLAEQLKLDFELLLHATNVRVDEKYIIYTDPVSGFDDIYTYSFTRQSPTEPVRLLLNQEGSEFETYDAFWRRRLRFSQAGERMRKLLREDLGKTKVVPAAVEERQDGRRIPTTIESVLQSNVHADLNTIFVLGDGGRGKSTVLRNWAIENLSQSDLTLPLFVDIHGKSFASIPEHISFELDKVAPLITFNGFMRLAALGLVTLVLDGFDELGVELGEETLFQRLSAFMETIRSERADCQRCHSLTTASTLILSGRTQYFSNINLRSRLALLPVPVAKWIEFGPWPPHHAIDFLRRNASKASLREDHLAQIQDTLERMYSPNQGDRELYAIIVHPVVLRVLFEAEIPFQATVTQTNLTQRGWFRGMISLLSQGVEALLKREETKHKSASGETLFPADIQLQILEQLCKDLMDNNEDPLRFEPYYVEYAAMVAAQARQLDQDATRRIVGAAPQHVLFGLGASSHSKTLGFLHPMLFDIIAGWVVSERLMKSAMGTDRSVSTILASKHQSDELLASAVERLQRMPGAMQLLADVTQTYLNAPSDITAAWNLAKLCFDRRLSGMASVRPFEGHWSIKGFEFVQVSFDEDALQGAVFTSCEFSLCDLTLPQTDPPTFEGCEWSQSTLVINKEAKGRFRLDCRPTLLTPIIHGHTEEKVADLEGLRRKVASFPGIEFTPPPVQPGELSRRQHVAKRFAILMARVAESSESALVARFPADVPIVHELIALLKGRGTLQVRQRTRSHQESERVLHLQGDIISIIDDLIERKEWQ